MLTHMFLGIPTGIWIFPGPAKPIALQESAVELVVDMLELLFLLICLLILSFI